MFVRTSRQLGCLMACFAVIALGCSSAEKEPKKSPIRSKTFLSRRQVVEKSSISRLRRLNTPPGTHRKSRRF